MKIRWWLLGAFAIVTGSFLVARHFNDNKRTFNYIEGEGGKSSGELHPDVSESEFDDVDFQA
jgi:hypothetical protein